MQATAIVVGISLVIMLVQGLRHGTLPASETTLARPSAGLFLAGVALLVIDMLSFGPFVSDYTRYLPARTNGRRLFWAIYAGNILATVGSCAIGAYLTALLPSLTPVAAVGKISGKWALIIMALSLVNANTFNAYTGSFQVLAFGSMWRRFKAESVTVRLVPFLCVMAVGVVIACLGYQSFVTNLSSFLDVLLVLFIPWSAVNLADYFLVATATTTSPRSSPPTANMANSPGAGCWPTRSAWPRNGRSSPSPTTPARWSKRSAAPISPGWPAGSPPPSSTCSWSPWPPAPPATTGPSPRPPDSPASPAGPACTGPAGRPAPGPDRQQRYRAIRYRGLPSPGCWPIQPDAPGHPGIGPRGGHLATARADPTLNAGSTRRGGRCARGSGKLAGALSAGVLEGRPGRQGPGAHMRRALQRPVAQARSR